MRTREALRAAKRMGREAGESAASWYVFHDENAKANVLRGIRDGDPAIMDTFPYPNLSGEWADAPTPKSLAEDIGLDPESEQYDWLIDAICTEWEDAARDAVESEIERMARS